MCCSCRSDETEAQSPPGQKQSRMSQSSSQPDNQPTDQQTYHSIHQKNSPAATQKSRKRHSHSHWRKRALALSSLPTTPDSQSKNVEIGELDPSRFLSVRGEDRGKPSNFSTRGFLLR